MIFPVFSFKFHLSIIDLNINQEFVFVRIYEYTREVNVKMYVRTLRPVGRKNILYCVKQKYFVSKLLLSKSSYSTSNRDNRLHLIPLPTL